MNARLTNFVTAHYIILTRSFIIVLGCIAIWWGVVGFRFFLQESASERIASQIIAGDPFKAETLALQLPVINRIGASVYCDPVALRSATIIQLRTVEVAISANDSKRSDEQMRSLGRMIRHSLSCGPADPFLWLVLYWVENTENGFNTDHLKYLRMSYRLGPNEGWIGLKRNRITFAALPNLPTDLAEYASKEFTGLVEMGSYEQAAEILTGPAWPLRQQLLSRLRNIEKRHRVIFADILDKKGYDVAIPGVETPSSRPPH